MPELKNSSRIIPKIELSGNHPNGSGKIFVVVEGINDSKFYKSIFKEDVQLESQAESGCWRSRESF
jgi:hypothetical protein